MNRIFILFIVILLACGGARAQMFAQRFGARDDAWTPPSIANCALWLDASDAATITLDGTAVTAWADKSAEDGHIRVSWELLSTHSPPVPVLIDGGIETPVLVLQSQAAGKGIGVITTDDGDLTTYIDHESPRPDDATIKARIAAAIEAKRTVKHAAKQASRNGNLQARIAALERLLGVAE